MAGEMPVAPQRLRISVRTIHPLVVGSRARPQTDPRLAGFPDAEERGDQEKDGYQSHQPVFVRKRHQGHPQQQEAAGREKAQPYQPGALDRRCVVRQDTLEKVRPSQDEAGRKKNDEEHEREPTGDWERLQAGCSGGACL